MNNLLRKILEKSSFHGFAYVARRDIHPLERIFWGILLMIATYCSISLCWNQWVRYKENPTVFGVERIIGTREFPFVGVTMCSNYFNEKQAEAIIQKTWDVSPNGSQQFKYYIEFLRILSATTYDNLELLAPYQNDSNVNNIPYLQVLVDLRSALFFNKTKSGKEAPTDVTIQYGSNDVGASNFDDEKNKPHYFNNVITEVGMCITTSYLHEYLNPLGFKREPEKVKHMEMCSPFDVCNLMITPSSDDGNHIIAYIHSNKDVVPHDDREAIKRDIFVHQITKVDVDLETMSAERQVRNVPIQYRKCRFPDENNLKYFKIYRPILCRIECRIKAALKLCNCRPFFYVVGEGPICGIKGMQCLVESNWKDTKCKQCMDLCSSMKYTALKATSHTYSETQFETTLVIKLRLPQLGMRRRVVFSIDQLVVAFGGAASFFLGCSFISFAQIIIICIEALIKKYKTYRRR